MLKNTKALLGLTCGDCAYFEPGATQNSGVCLTSLSFQPVNREDEACEAITIQGCETEEEQACIQSLREKFAWRGGIKQ